MRILQCLLFVSKGSYICYYIKFSTEIHIKTKIILNFFYGNSIQSSILQLSFRDRSSHQKCSMKKVLLEISQNSQENTCTSVSFLIKLQAIGLRPPTLLKKRLWQVFSCEFCEISSNIFSTEHLWTTASVVTLPIQYPTNLWELEIRP